MPRILIALLLLLLPAPALTQPSAEGVVRASIERLRGDSSYFEQTMIVHRPDWDREVSMVSITRGTTDGLVRFTAPTRDAGNATLKLDRDMWVFTPRLNQVVKLPASLMAQSWMGSDFSYDDLAKADTILHEYTFRMLPGETRDGRSVYVVEAVPRANAPVVWGREVFRIRDDYLVLERAYYDQENVLVKRMTTRRVGQIGGQPYPIELRMENAEREGHWTTVITRRGFFNVSPPAYLFTLSNLSNPRDWAPR